MDEDKESTPNISLTPGEEVKNGDESEAVARLTAFASAPLNEIRSLHDLSTFMGTVGEDIQAVLPLHHAPVQVSNIAENMATHEQRPIQFKQWHADVGEAQVSVTYDADTIRITKIDNPEMLGKPWAQIRQFKIELPLKTTLSEADKRFVTAEGVREQKIDYHPADAKHVRDAKTQRGYASLLQEAVKDILSTLPAK